MGRIEDPAAVYERRVSVPWRRGMVEIDGSRLDPAARC